MYTSTPLNLNGWNQGPKGILNNFYPTSRSLWNVWANAGSTGANVTTITGSAAGFINYLCDSNNDFQKGRDNSTGYNFDSEVGSLIGSFGFQRLSDTSSAPTANSGSTTPADGFSGAASNTACCRHDGKRSHCQGQRSPPGDRERRRPDRQVVGPPCM